MIKPNEILEFNRILQDKCDNYDDCRKCPLKRKYPDRGCVKDNQADKAEAKRLVDFVYGKRSNKSGD